VNKAQSLIASQKSRAKNIRKMYRRYTAKGQPLESVKARGPVWGDYPPQTAGLNEIREYFNCRYDQPAHPTTPAEVAWIQNLAKDDSVPNSMGYFARRFINLHELPAPLTSGKTAKIGCVLLDLRALQIMAREDIKMGITSYSNALVTKLVKIIKKNWGATYRIVGLVDLHPEPIRSFLVENLDLTVNPNELDTIGDIALVVDPVVVTVGNGLQLLVNYWR
jgi:hypothetical protein